MRKVLFLSLLLIAIASVVSTPALADNVYMFGGSGGTFSSAGTNAPGVGLDTAVAIINGIPSFPTIDALLQVNTSTGAVDFSGLYDGNPFTFTGTAVLADFVIDGCMGGNTCDIAFDGSFAPGVTFNGTINSSSAPDANLNYSADSVVFNMVQATPEPASMALLASGLAFLGGLRRRKR